MAGSFSGSSWSFLSSFPLLYKFLRLRNRPVFSQWNNCSPSWRSACSFTCSARVLSFERHCDVVRVGRYVDSAGAVQSTAWSQVSGTCPHTRNGREPNTIAFTRQRFQHRVSVGLAQFQSARQCSSVDSALGAGRARRRPRQVPNKARLQSALSRCKRSDSHGTVYVLTSKRSLAS